MSEAATVPVDEKLFAQVIEQHARVAEARSQFNTARETAKSKKLALDGALETFETMFKRLANTTNGSDLPLFSMSDAIAKAEADPVVMGLCKRLVDAGQDVNALIVAGYTEEERNRAAEYLDTRDELIANGHDPNAAVLPPFLMPPDLTAVEVADLFSRLVDADIETDEATIRGWSRVQLQEVRAWLTNVEAVKAEKGEGVTFDDLPPAPAWLADRPDVDEDGTDDETEEATDEANA